MDYITKSEKHYLLQRKSSTFLLYLVTDPFMKASGNLSETVEQAIKGGVTAIQYRAKNLDKDTILGQVRELLCVCQKNCIPLLINDYVFVAVDTGADGVHIGQSDMKYSEARKILGSESLIGLTVTSSQDVKEAGKADYLGVSSIFPTSTKPDAPPAAGTAVFRKFRSLTGIPLIGIGGINASNADEVIRAGADGIAVVSAIMNSDDPFTAASELREIVDKAIAERNDNKQIILD